MAGKRRHRRQIFASRAEMKRLCTDDSSDSELKSSKKLKSVEFENAKNDDVSDLCINQIVDALQHFEVYSSSSSSSSSDEMTDGNATDETTQIVKCFTCKRRKDTTAERRGNYSDRHRRARKKLAQIPFEDPEFVFLYEYINDESDFEDDLPNDNSDSDDFEEDFDDNDDAFGDYDFYESDSDWIDIDEEVDISENATTISNNMTRGNFAESNEKMKKIKGGIVSSDSDAKKEKVKKQRKLRRRRRKSAGNTELIAIRKQSSSARARTCKCGKQTAQHATNDGNPVKPKSESHKAAKSEKQKTIELEELKVKRRIQHSKRHRKYVQKVKQPVSSKQRQQQQLQRKKMEPSKGKTRHVQSRRQQRSGVKSNGNHKSKF